MNECIEQERCMCTHTPLLFLAFFVFFLRCFASSFSSMCDACSSAPLSNTSIVQQIYLILYRFGSLDHPHSLTNLHERSLGVVDLFVCVAGAHLRADAREALGYNREGKGGHINPFFHQRAGHFCR